MFDKFTREFIEMSYQFKRPFVLDSSRTEATFGLHATDLDEALGASINDDAPAADAPAEVGRRPRDSRDEEEHDDRGPGDNVQRDDW